MNYLGTFITNPDIESYLSSLMPSEDPVLREMEEVSANIDLPIVGPIVGRLLNQLTTLSGAKRIFEMGSGIGYSAYWFAMAAGDGGIVYVTDKSETNLSLAERFLSKGGMRERVVMSLGDSLSTLEESKGNYDIIFNDIDKEEYPAVVKKAYYKLRKGGMFISDNLLWFGRVLTDDDSPSTLAVKEFTRMLLDHKGFFTTIIPIRDGISISVKL